MCSLIQRSEEHGNNGLVVVCPPPPRSFDRWRGRRFFGGQEGFPKLPGEESAGQRKNDQSHDAADGKDAIGKTSSADHGLYQSGKKQVSRGSGSLFFPENPKFHFIFRFVHQAFNVFLVPENDYKKN